MATNSARPPVAAGMRFPPVWLIVLACAGLGAGTRSNGMPSLHALPVSAEAPASTTTWAVVAPPADESPVLPRMQVLRRTLRADARQEYFLYVPRAGGRNAPLLVTVHGISRNAEEHAAMFSDHAEANGVVLVAPCFTVERHDDYQRLGRVGRGVRADFALDSIVAEVARLTGADAEKIYLFGFSGGAQFAHRYAMAHPHRVARAVVAAAGWYTFPDPRTPYPYGIGPSQELPSLRFDPAEFLRVPIAVLVGAQDSTNESLRRNEEVDRQQGVTRFERARNWVAAMRAAARAHHLDPLVTFVEVDGIHHSFRQFMQEGRLGERVFDALFGQPAAKRPRTDPSPESDEQRSGSQRRSRNRARDAEADLAGSTRR